MDKRTFLRTSALLGAGALVVKGSLAKGMTPGTSFTAAAAKAGDEFVLPPLPYAYEALEPYIDAQTMHLHHDKHHAGYTANLNAAVVSEHLQGIKIEDLIMHVSKYSTAVRNQGGGYYNHSFFWETLSPKKGTPGGALASAINRDFGSLQKLEEELSKKSLGVFGSGWGWLVYDEGKLKTIITSNQDNPMMDIATEKGMPLLNIDVWEHAYYLKYQNRRKEYLEAIWNVINWPKIEERFTACTKMA